MIEMAEFCLSLLSQSYLDAAKHYKDASKAAPYAFYIENVLLPLINEEQ